MGQLSLLTIILTIIIIPVLMFTTTIIVNMFTPTRGKRIISYPRPTRALLVMDIQESCARESCVTGPLPATTPFGKMIQSVNSLIECFDRAGLEIAYVRQVFSSNFITRLHSGRILAGRMEPRICRWVSVVNKNDFAKNRTDAFSNRRLEQFLINREVNEIFLVGLDAAFCVYYTALGALQRGYRVTVVTDAIMTGRKMTRVLKRYQEKGCTVMNSPEILRTNNCSGTGYQQDKAL